MWTLIDHLLPACRCLCCQLLPANDDGFCSGCLADLPYLGAACSHCGLPVGQSGCTCATEPWPFTAVICPFSFHFPVNHLIYHYKDGGQFVLARAFARQLAKAADRQQHWQKPQLLLPVPAAPSHLAIRGFNPAGELARQLSLQLQIPWRYDLLQRHDQDTAQKNLNAAQRLQHMQKAFSLTSGVRLPPRVAIIDDVMTTGSTVRSLATLLHHAGVRDIQAWAIARTTLQ